MAASTSARQAPEPRRRNPRGDGRRALILNALHDCIIEQGYANTTLADVARKAKMTPSHLLYYYEGKDAMLAAYFEKVANLIVERLESFRNQPVSKQIDLVAELFFAGKGITRYEIGFMLECFGVAVHHEQLRAQKAALDRVCKSYLRSLFRGSASRDKAGNCAELAYSLLIGLRTAAYFDQRLGLPKALRLFRAEMHSLAGV